MNSSIALRLLWKEYRVQRGLWLSMAGGSIALQALITFLISSDQESFQGIVPIAFMLTFFYAIGSGAITFAIEREEGTQLRPVMLGCPPGLTLTVKTIFGIVATALLLATTICSGMLLSLGRLTLPENTFHPEAQRMIIPLALLFVGLPYLGSLLWSTFFSLLTRKVIVALGLAAIAMIVSFVVVASVSDAIVGSYSPSRQPVNLPQLFVASLVPCVLALLILAMNYLLTHRWLTRAFFDQTSSKSPSFFKRWRIGRSGLDGGMVVEIGVEDRTAFEVVSPEVAVHQPPPRFGLSLLYAMWGPNLWRHLRFLRWREAIETRKLFVGFLLATLFLIIWAFAWKNYRTDWHAIGFFIHAACVACGAMAFRGEQDERKVQRLADMGLRPATVWLSKHVVWFVRAVISVVAILFCVLFPLSLQMGVSQFLEVGVTPFLHLVFQIFEVPDRTGNHSPQELVTIGRAAILMLTMYGVGQACSQLIRSTIVSLFISFILGLTAFGWAAVCYYFGVPFILSVLPLAIGCLMVTWCRTKSWMIDDNRGRAWVWPTAAITVAIAIIYFGTGLFRVYEIPWSKPFFSDGSSTEVTDGLTAEQRASVVAPVTDEELATFELYQRASELIGRNDFRLLDVRLLDDRETAQELWEALSADEQRATEEAIELALKAAESPVCAKYNPTDTDVAYLATTTRHTPFGDAIDLIVFEAERKIDLGKLLDALENYRSALAVSRHAAGRSGELAWWFSRHGTMETLRGLRRWAAHPDCSQELIDEAVGMIDEHRRQMMPMELANYSSALMVRNTLDADVFTTTDLLLGISDKRFPVLLASRFPGENARSHRLLNALEATDVEQMAAFRMEQAKTESGAEAGMADWIQRQRDRRYSLTESPLPSLRYHALRSTALLALIVNQEAIVEYCSTEIRTDCDVRATKIVMQLLEQQRNGEDLPATLDRFDCSLNDPWTDKPFTWYPEGLPGNLINGSSVIVEANTPFLMTTRADQVTFRRAEHFAEDLFYPDTAHVTEIDGVPSIEESDNQASNVLRVEFYAESAPHLPASNFRVWKIPKKAVE